MLGSAVLGAELKVRISWGHDSTAAAPYYVRLAPETGGLEIRDAAGYQLEPGEGLKGDAWQSTAGAGDIDGVSFTLVYPQEPATRLQNLHIIWADLIAQSDADTARRLDRPVPSMVVIGGGAVACEYASIFSALGTHVTLVESRGQLLPFVDEIGRAHV